MKKWFLWMCICIIHMSILLYIGNFFEYTGNKIKLSAPVKIQKENKYITWEERKIEENPDYKNLGIYIDINEKILELINLDNNNILKKYVIASGKSDTPSPIGNWKIVGKSSWGKGFGTRWMGIDVPWGKYGIHGTNKPNSIGWASSHGCIRMKNKDIEELYKLVKVGMPIAIRGGVFGPFGNGFRTLEPGARGSDVYEVQRYMKEKGYYPGWIDGIYGEGMKVYVIQFRKDHNLSLSHNVDVEFYKALGIELFE
ncbi:L,D-transpeptidase family protein [Inediibacterium massiliense]|uniref:L,D-transpeptidase family protein n=1 Tax=Inediibacterium massiliense TaxID=1658111 RepID=UPI0006B67786|nr:L,D-transpeptidase family protein [Inediibacterium massiliense]